MDSAEPVTNNAESHAETKKWKRSEKKKKNANKEPNGESEEKGLKKERQKGRRRNKRKRSSSTQVTKLTSEFVSGDITNNEEASNLIKELVKCYTNNSALPASELDVLKSSLYEKTVSVFLFVLNSCIAKIVRRLQENSLVLKLEGKNDKKNASCQTDISGDVVPVDKHKKDNQTL